MTDDDDEERATQLSTDVKASTAYQEAYTWVYLQDRTVPSLDGKFWVYPTKDSSCTVFAIAGVGIIAVHRASNGVRMSILPGPGQEMRRSIMYSLLEGIKTLRTIDYTGISKDKN